MRRMALMLAAVALLGAPAMVRAQGGFFGQANPLSLLVQKSVQEELSLTADQVEKATQAVTKQRESLGGLRDLSQEERTARMREVNQEAEKSVKEILKPEQAKRLREVFLQVQGGRALANPTLAQELNLTDEQKQKVRETLTASQEKMRDIFQGGGDDREAMLKKIQELNKETGTKIVDMLTDAQKTKWKELTGKPFTGKIEFGPRRQS